MYKSVNGEVESKLFNDPKEVPEGWSDSPDEAMKVELTALEAEKEAKELAALEAATKPDTKAPKDDNNN